MTSELNLYLWCSTVLFSQYGLGVRDAWNGRKRRHPVQEKVERIDRLHTGASAHAEKTIEGEVVMSVPAPAGVDLNGLRRGHLG